MKNSKRVLYAKLFSIGFIFILSILLVLAFIKHLTTQTLTQSRLIGFISLLVVMYLLPSKLIFRAKADVLEGEVVDVLRHFRSIKVEVKYKNADGKDLTTNSTFGYSMFPPKIGDKAFVCYDSRDPDDAEIYNWNEQWGVILLFTTIGIINLLY